MLAHFGATTLIGSDGGDARRRGNSHSPVTANDNGLPSPPATTRMLGRFWKLAAMDHPHLCRYLELTRCHAASNGAVLVSEHHPVRYWDYARQSDNDLGPTATLSLARQLSSAVEYCHRQLVVIGYLTLDCVSIAEAEAPLKTPVVKLEQYGLYHVTGMNDDFDQILGGTHYMHYTAPERLAVGNERRSASFKSDIWALGIVLFEIFAKSRLEEAFTREEWARLMESFMRAEGEGRRSLLSLLLETVELALEWPEGMYEVVDKCLRLLPSHRPSAGELCQMLGATNCEGVAGRMSRLDESAEEMRVRLSAKTDECFNRPLKELFYLWKLCGSGVERILINEGVIKLRPPISTLPLLVVDDFRMFGNEAARNVHIPFTIHRLPSGNLRRRLKSISQVELAHSFELERALDTRHNRDSGISRDSSVDRFDLSMEQQSLHRSLSEQTLIIRERDIEYQLRRMALFRRLLAYYPYKFYLLRAECRRDIPPLYRGQVWAALLDALVPQEEADDEFYAIDTLSEQVSDRQLQVDIPRCHQYDELMTTPEAHSKLKQMLKAWLATHPQYVYWQGLDSLAAPFLVLHFNNLPLAFKCLCAFIDRYLPNFFLQDNAVIMREYLASFMRLLERIDPELHAHLLHLDFQPELFAIPWFLTCFAHVLPLHKLFHLWDALLLADVSFPLFIGVAILKELRADLMTAQFNDAILLFSDLPDLSIDNVVTNSLKYYESLPPELHDNCDHSNGIYQQHASL